MAMNRAQFPELMGYFAGGIAASGADLEDIFDVEDQKSDEDFLQDYIDQLKSLETERPTNLQITERMKELQELLQAPTQRNPIFDLASSLARGLIQNSQSARPNVLGYGLAAGS